MVNFSDPSINTNYTSSSEPNDAGMQILYDITNIFLDAVVTGSKLLPDGFMNQFGDLDDFIDKFPEKVTEDAQSVVEANTAIVATVAVGVVLTVLMPIIGIIFCCCVGCGKCGGKKEQPKENDGLKRIVLSVLFFILILTATLGCVWFFRGNATAKKGTEELPQAMKNFIEDDEIFIKNTKLQFSYLLDENFQEANAAFGNILDDTADNEIPMLTQSIINGTNLDDLMQTVKEISNLTKIYNAAVLQLDRIKDDTNLITTTLNKIVADLEKCKILLSCPVPPLVGVCKQLDEIAEVFIGVKNITTELDNLPHLTDLDMSVMDPILSILEEAYGNIDDITSAFVDEYFEDMRNQVEEIGDSISGQMGDIAEMLDTLTIPALLNMTATDLDAEIDTLKDNIDTYYSIFQYTLIGFGSVTVVILAIFLMSLAMGSCESAGSKSSQCASRLLCVTLGLFFFLAFFLFLVATIFFIVGAVGEKFVCRALGDPGEAQIIKLINPLLNETLNNVMSDIADEQVHVDWNIAAMIEDIHNGSTVYNVFHLEYIYNIEDLKDWKTTYNIIDIIEKAKVGIDDTISSVVNKMNIDDKKPTIMEMANKFDDFIPDLKTITNISIEEYMYLEEIDEAIDSITNITTVVTIPAVETTLNNLIDDIEYLKGNLTEISTSWDETTKLMEEILDMFDPSKPSDMVNDTFDSFNEAIHWINDTGRTDVLDILNTTIDKVFDVIDDYVEHGISTVNTELGSLTPVSDMWDATDASLCQNLLDPFNSVWSGLGWTLLFILLPLSMVSCSLMSIYGRDKEPLVQPFQFQKGNLKMNPRSQATVDLDDIDMRNYSGDSQGGHQSGNQHVPYSIPAHYKPQQQIPTSPDQNVHYTVPDHYKPTSTPNEKNHYTVPDHYKPIQQEPANHPTEKPHYTVPDHYKPNHQTNFSGPDSKVNYAIPDHYKPSAPNRYEVPPYYKPNQK